VRYNSVNVKVVMRDKCCEIWHDEEIKSVNALRGGVNAAPVVLIFRWYFILAFKFPLIFYFNR
jgi:hypothetical protein